MKLYFSPGACSFAPHLVLRELGIPFELVKVDLKAKLTADGRDFSQINSKGYVPCLELDNGKILTEGVSIMQYLADQKPETGLAPKPGTMERYDLIETLNYISTEIHKGFSPLFGADRMISNPEGNEQLKTFARQNLLRRLQWFEEKLAHQQYACGSTYTIADAYLTTTLRWSRVVKFDLSTLPNVSAYLARMHDRPALHAAAQAEGLKG